MYKLVNNFDGTLMCILKPSENLSIPIDTLNREYLEYLKWLAEGNTPEPADE